MRRRPAGWDPPGPVPPGARGDPDLVPGPDETLDCLAGHWRIFQLRRGHRYSTDDLLTAWAACDAWTGRGRDPAAVLDLGCGVGSVGLLVLWRFPAARLVGVEAQARSAALARRTARYNGADGRVEIRTGDLRDRSMLRPDERFDLVTASPPYLPRGTGRRSTLPQRGPCRFEDRGGTADYLGVAARHLARGGTVTWVHATRYRNENVATAITAGLGRIRCRPVVFREGRDSLITLFRAEPGDGVRDDPPLVVRDADGRWTGPFRAARRAMGFPA